MTDRESLGIVPDPDFCVVLFNYAFPQIAKFYWVTSGIVTVKGDDVWILVTADELDAHNLTPGKGCFAAPTCEEFMRLIPPQYFVMWAKSAFAFVDLTKTNFGAPDKAGDRPKINLVYIKDAAAPKAADCWAKGVCYLIINKMIFFKNAEESPMIHKP